MKNPDDGETFGRIAKAYVSQFPGVDLLPLGGIVNAEGADHLSEQLFEMIDIARDLYRVFNPNLPLGSLENRRKKATQVLSGNGSELDLDIAEAGALLPRSMSPAEVDEMVVKLWDYRGRLDGPSGDDDDCESGSNMDEVAEALGVRRVIRENEIYMQAPGRKLLLKRLEAQGVILDIVGSRGIADDISFVRALGEHDALYSCGPETLHDLVYHILPLVSARMDQSDPDSFQRLHVRQKEWLKIWGEKLEGEGDLAPAVRSGLAKSLGAWADMASAAPYAGLRVDLLRVTRRLGPIRLAWNAGPTWETYFYEQFPGPADGKRPGASAELTALEQAWERISPIADLAD